MLYGKELILDLHGCSRTSPEDSFFADLCDLIDMQREDLHYWGPSDSDDPKISGLSAVQFILTSSIVVHGLDKQRSVYVNLFSCKEFDAERAAAWIAEWFGSKDRVEHVIERTMPSEIDSI